jgi:hypothetical protein
MEKRSMEDEIEKEFQFYKLLKIKRIVIKKNRLNRRKNK